MIKLYRISTSEHIADLSGTGAKIYGGRWNHPGYPVVYCSTSRSLAALEFLVHVPMDLAPADLSIVEINVKGAVSKEIVNENSLPENWREYPAPDLLAAIGTNWIKQKSSLLLQIPSAVMEQEFNILVNPLHKEIGKVNIAKTENFSFDPRLLKS